MVIDGDALYCDMYHSICHSNLSEGLNWRRIYSQLQDLLIFLQENKFKIKAIFYDALTDIEKIDTLYNRKIERKKTSLKAWNNDFKGRCIVLDRVL